MFENPKIYISKKEIKMLQINICYQRKSFFMKNFNISVQKKNSKFTI